MDIIRLFYYTYILVVDKLWVDHGIVYCSDSWMPFVYGMASMAVLATLRFTREMIYVVIWHTRV